MALRYPDPLRRIHDGSVEKHLGLIFLINIFLLPALIIAQLYRRNWQGELLFRWFNKHRRIKLFYGATEHAVKPQA